MHISAPTSIPAARFVAAPVAPDTPVSSPEADWTNPAAAAALRITVELLNGIEDGIVRNFESPEKVRELATDMRSTADVFETAHQVISSDTSKENDSFLPLLENAGTGVSHAESRLTSKEFSSLWPVERSDILAAIRRAKTISSNVADQLDPRRRPRP